MSESRMFVERVQAAVAALAAGRPIVVVDDEDRENEGDLIMAAEYADAESLAFIVRHTTGIVCAPMSAARADELKLPLMVDDNSDVNGTAFTVTVDHASTGTGVSAADRAATLSALADPTTPATSLHRPGHIFPLRARDGGVLVRAGHTEAAVDLTTMAGLSGVGVIGEIVAENGSMRSGDDLLCFARKHDLVVLAIADLVEYRRVTHPIVTAVSSASMPTRAGTFRAVVYRSESDGIEHLVLVRGDVAAAGSAVEGALVRVHSECLTGDTLGSLRCDCGGQLEQALETIADEGCGALVYLRGHEGRGIGLANKIRAYSLQEAGLDTIDANTVQGLPDDSRSYGIGAEILHHLGISRLRLISNNPAKFDGLRNYGLTVVGRVSLPAIETPENVRYLRSKRDRMGHELELRSSAAGS
ncbi:bifunctional 3,4-dihydroxy-2-butanone-4-phosphate synthase/GTP cyclohydrolase II [Rhodococcus sp. NCIMB 12038]|uniref:bifunctional 3,4-dihydroxy-2-butanone-4-phosphate synthase/GTP cyclohydrolase II n=1 Tax=Rhodococcus sp. NCIMB 12038 TaxID=933800 RepID=UPI000B55F421|nr:bifunctional 3,4-dihydroxy-2-butanone-4-phosphate synthase/GTP cyclohydrolase II [Rhodococcus sp. NCIMB 12038]OUS96779.1 bifunctional 3,4-dihydroxy-2-butanone-4-phosphate synthase/GTP cyclohydrolase II [Rhodococcus sp. NCIMB 12038]